MQIHEQFRLDPTVDGLHRRIICGRASARHGTRDAVHRQQFIESFRGIYGALIGMQDHLVFRMLPFKFNQILQSAYVGHAVSAFGVKGMTDDLIIPEIHIQGEFVIDALHIESRHVTHNALQRPIDLHLRQKQIGKYAVRIAWFLVSVMLGFALGSRLFCSIYEHRDQRGQDRCPGGSSRSASGIRGKNT